MISNAKFYIIHKSANDSLRLGQRFCNMYIKNSWPELFYADDITANTLIQKWLRDHQYYDELPQVKEEFKCYLK